MRLVSICRQEGVGSGDQYGGTLKAPGAKIGQRLIGALQRVGGGFRDNADPVRNDVRCRTESIDTQSRWLARQSAALSESNRIKFCQLVPASVNTDGSAPPLSPGLQRAMLMAIARELGWFESKPGAPDDSRFGQTPFSIDGIDFVNLHPNTNGVAYQAPPQPSAQSTATPQTTIPGFVAGNKLVLAVDSTVAPPQSSVTFTVTDANQNQTGGTVVLGDNPTVVTIPLTAEFAQGGVAPGPFIPTGLIPTPDGYLAVTVSSLSSSGIFSTNWFIMPANP